MWWEKDVPALSYRPPKSVYIIHTSKKKRPSGTSLQRSLRQLRAAAKDDSQVEDIRQRVLKGEITASQALIQIGKRQKRYGISTSPKSVITFAQKYLTPEEMLEVAQELERIAKNIKEE